MRNTKRMRMRFAKYAQTYFSITLILFPILFLFLKINWMLEWETQWEWEWEWGLLEYVATYFYQSLFEHTHYRSAMHRTFEKVYLNRLYNLLEFYNIHSVPKNRRRLSRSIPRRDTPIGHSLPCNISHRHSSKRYAHRAFVAEQQIILDYKWYA